MVKNDSILVVNGGCWSAIFVCFQNLVLQKDIWREKMNWSKYFTKTILDRGFRYYERGAVSDVSNINTLLFFIHRNNFLVIRTKTFRMRM